MNEDKLLQMYNKHLGNIDRHYKLSSHCLSFAKVRLGGFVKDIKKCIKEFNSDILGTEWKELCEEDYNNLKETRQQKTVIPRLIYIDKHKNHHYFVEKKD